MTTYTTEAHGGAYYDVQPSKITFGNTTLASGKIGAILDIGTTLVFSFVFILCKSLKECWTLVKFYYKPRFSIST